jgi:hypothetical protein
MHSLAPGLAELRICLPRKGRGGRPHERQNEAPGRILRTRNLRFVGASVSPQRQSESLSRRGTRPLGWVPHSDRECPRQGIATTKCARDFPHRRDRTGRGEALWGKAEILPHQRAQSDGNLDARFCSKVEILFLRWNQSWGRMHRAVVAQRALLRFEEGLSGLICQVPSCHGGTGLLASF